ncbi:hypothetical protein [Tissierella sp. Yu-01]|uniref:hypothetical protein n=1 Tax=Tissierella sp. Yu-01 TaxID=3035694 RepID=UPI00240DE765|nr:hypothetical protein [Tissierella sp. Yu-01]WFA07819.1 hypothetical protein P3962_08745 [Tissierella sp. Yu-01]
MKRAILIFMIFLFVIFSGCKETELESIENSNAAEGPKEEVNEKDKVTMTVKDDNMDN